MDLSNKLNFYRSTQAKPVQSAIPASVKLLQQHFNGRIVGEQYPYLKIVREYELNYPPSIALTLLSKGSLSAPVPLDRCLFFDLETTGLTGGTGTFPFLIGIGYFKDNLFTVEQFFLPDFGREYEALRCLNDALPDYNYLISFNGKSYDLPLLKSRFILNRLQTEWERLIHIDLLHMARRIWKDSLDTLQLGSIEERLLKRKRTGDIPGGLIPQAYFTFLQSGVVHDMIRIIEHNYLDIISMADLIILLAKMEDNPLHVTDSAALIRMAKLAYEQDNTSYFNRVWNRFEARQEVIPAPLKRWRSLMARREKNWELACALWEELLEDRAYYFFALEELAKFYEHQQNDFRQALVYTQRGLKTLETVEELNPYHPHLAFKEEFLIRQKRLSKKQTS